METETQAVTINE